MSKRKSSNKKTKNNFGAKAKVNNGKKRKRRENDASVQITRKKTHSNKNHKSVYIDGILRMTTRGFAFVEITEDESREDIFIHSTKLNGAMHNDVVKIALVESRGEKEEGVVVDVLSRAMEEAVGIFHKQKAYGFVITANSREEDIFIPKQFTSGAKDGDVVVAKIMKYPERGNSAEGKITEIIARKNEAGADIKMILREKGIRETFPSSALAEATHVSKSELILGDRVDLRKECIFTIDGDDSKDFDDAVSIEKNERGNWVLGVHIADVAHYVQEDKALDKEAFKRGNSIYLLNRVVPMLPQNLSNGICSLNPNEDRLTLSIDMEIDSNLKVSNYKIYESVINSKYRLTYNVVSDFLEKCNKDEQVKAEEYSKERRDRGTGEFESVISNFDLDIILQGKLVQMNNLAMKLKEEREKLGSIDFDLDEAHIVLNKDGIPLEINLADRRSAHKLIEEFMLLANKTIAEHFYHLQLPFVYRSHKKPELESMENLKEFLKGLGISISGNLENIHPMQIAEILEKGTKCEYGDVVSRVVLRTMQKAAYDTTCEGHFGLAFRHYCHFTSPIRRYSDLMIHRIIKNYIKGNDVLSYEKKVAAVATNCSTTERIAIELEREVEKLKKAEYMTYHIGDKYDGIISGVTSFGIYVELPNTIEGMIRLDDLGKEYYEYHHEKKALIGAGTGETFTLGDKVRIEVKNASTEKKEVDFYLIRNQHRKG